MKMLLNLTNHPSANWSERQRKMAKAQYGRVVDWPFPAVPFGASTEGVSEMAHALAAELAGKFDPTATTVHLMGEMTLTFALVGLLQTAGFRCVASCRERVGEEGAEAFVFKNFREYPPLCFTKTNTT